MIVIERIVVDTGSRRASGIRRGESTRRQGVYYGPFWSREAEGERAEGD
jgi:hypothetical protein